LLIIIFGSNLCIYLAINLNIPITQTQGFTLVQSLDLCSGTKL